MPEVSIASVNAVVSRLADEVSGAAAQAIARRGFFSVALAGGSVATKCFPTLAQLPVSWSNVHFFWADERSVPPSDPESNFGLADRLWLTPAGVPESSVHRMPADAPDLAAAADTYTSELMRVLGAEAVLDLALLGMGPDGHIASLFPGHALLAEQERLVSPILDSPKPPARRLTLTLPVLTKVRRLIVVAFGSSKADALREALGHEESALPVAQLLRSAPSSLVLADETAGGGCLSR